MYCVLVHDPTGVPRIIWFPRGITGKNREAFFNLGSEPHHLSIQGRIAGNRKRRKRGVWQYDLKDREIIHFTCPWCGAVGTTSARYVDKDTHISVWCTPPHQGGCYRHLNLTFRRKSRARPVGWEGECI